MHSLPPGPPRVLAGCLAELPTPSQASRHGAGFPLLLPNPSHTAKETKEAEIISYRRLLLLADMGETLQARTQNAPTQKAWLVLNPLVSAARPSLPAFEVNNGKAGLSLLTPGKKKKILFDILVKKLISKHRFAQHIVGLKLPGHHRAAASLQSLWLCWVLF